MVGLAAMDEMGSSFYQAAKTVAREPSSPALEWWQTPDKYKKRVIEPKECDMINVSPGVRNGGTRGVDCAHNFKKFLGVFPLAHS